jgi:preprotein translocase SecE subunit
MSFAPYKWPQGRIMRYVAAAVCLSYVGFGAYRTYNWLSASKLPFQLGKALPVSLAKTVTPGVLGSVLLLLAGSVAIYSLVFVNVKVTDYLIQVEGEMRKVYWPKMKPWFAWSSELWGSTYVVVIVVVILSAFIFAVDLGFAPLAKWIFH